MKTLLTSLLLLTTYAALAAPPFDPKVDRFRLGIPTNSSADKVIEFNKGAGSSNPKLKLDGASGKIKFSDNGTTFKTFNLGTDIDSGASASGTVLTANGSGGVSWAASLSLAGMIFPFGSTPCPGGTLVADGAAVSRATYPNLFTAIGTNWGDAVPTRQTPPMAGNTGFGYTISASSIVNSTWDAWQAFNGFDNPYYDEGWVSAASPASPQYLMIQGPSATILSYSVSARYHANTSVPVSWTLQGSNNGSAWTTIDSRPTVSWGDRATLSGFRNSFLVATPGAYTYYKLNITAWEGGTTYVGVKELQLSTSASLGFNIPDRRNRFVRGTGTNSDGQGGDAVLLGQYQADVFKDHVHTFNGGWDNGSATPRTFTGGTQTPLSTTGATTGSGTETKPKAYGMNFCIVY